MPWGSFAAIQRAPLPHLPPSRWSGQEPPFWFSLHPTLQSESGGFRQKDNAKLAPFVVIAMMGFCPPREEVSSFPKQHVPDLFQAGFAWADLAMCANGLYLHSLGLQYQLEMQDLSRSLTS